MFLVSLRTRGSLFKTRETVAVLTFALSATFLMVTVSLAIMRLPEKTKTYHSVTGGTPFLRMIFPYFTVSPVITTTKALLALS